MRKPPSGSGAGHVPRDADQLVIRWTMETDGSDLYVKEWSPSGGCVQTWRCPDERTATAIIAERKQAIRQQIERFIESAARSTSGR